MDLSTYTRWDAAHKRSIRIAYQDIPNDDDWVIESRKYFGLNVFSIHQGVAATFGVPTVKSEDVDEAIHQARDNGDCVLYMFLLEHSGYRFQIQDSCPASGWDPGYCGVITLSRQKWSQTQPGKPFNAEFVADFLGNEFDEMVTAELNGSYYMAVIEDPDDDISYVRTSYRSPEEALKDAMSEHPDICLTEDDVSEVKTLTLKDAEALLSMLEEAHGAIGLDIVHGRMNAERSQDICENVVFTVEYSVIRRWLQGFFPEKYQGYPP